MHGTRYRNVAFIYVQIQGILTDPFTFIIACISPEVTRSIERSIHKSLADATSRQCKCVFLPECIGPGTFSCRNATTEATYRSKINGTVSHNVSLR